LIAGQSKGVFMDLSVRVEAEPKNKNPKRIAAGKLGGRPKKEDEEPRTRVPLWVSSKEKEVIEKAAAAMDKTVAGFIRDLIFEDTIVSDGSVLVSIKNQPCYLTQEQAKDLYKQLTKVLIGD
jgi:uncharacterized protein (DUF1778 family)